MRLNLIQAIILYLISTACSGPHTPFGPINNPLPPQDEVGSDKSTQASEELEVNESGRHLTISDNDVGFQADLFPSRIYYHKSENISMSLSQKGKVIQASDLRVTYDGRDITESFIHNSHITQNPDGSLVIEFDNVRFPPERINEIIFDFSDGSMLNRARFTYQQPYCPLNDMIDVQHTGDFSPEDSLLKSINLLARENHINPSLVAGLIAQESSFNPKAVSWAKAIGLTQITPLAADEIQREYHDWPRDSSIVKTPVPVIKLMVESGAITHQDDFRLNPTYSVHGGIAFIKHIEKYWRSKRNTELLGKYDDEDPQLITKAMIASYNFGPARIRRSIIESGLNWYKNKRADGAMNYVNRVQSFCHDFSLPAS